MMTAGSTLRQMREKLGRRSLAGWIREKFLHCSRCDRDGLIPRQRRHLVGFAVSG
jgi:hypothetical protein